MAEGYGRYFYKESKQFYFYARGSVQETKAWLSKCKRRQIVDVEYCAALLNEAEKIMAMLNAYIKFVANSQRKPLPKKG
ncbi:four helix bundle protein [Flavisolibacter ginsenosidimutans]|uniref:four helix bundle protein n=1 Tax=Flavisolibacter ginsenosidimutans TaxID=661481 RepID=UPI0037444C21